MEALLDGRHLTKFDFLDMTNSVCLAQRVLELRQEGWDIKDKPVKGKGNLREYWLEQKEINRIRVREHRIIENTIHIKKKDEDEQLLTQKQNIAETDQNTAQNEKYEQMGFGLLGGHNY
jgi:hypothetical protein